MKTFVIAFAFLLALNAHGEMRSVTVAGKVHSFDEKTVTVVVNKKKLQVPRESVRNQDFKAGDAVLITLRGDDLRYLVTRPERGPASDKKK